MPPEPKDAGGDAEEPVPVFGTWPRIYAAVVASALLVMALLALFSGWTY